MKQRLSDKHVKQYIQLVDGLSKDNPLERPLIKALETLASALRNAQDEDNFPQDLNLIVQNVLLISDKNTTLEKKEAALTTLLEPPLKHDKFSSIANVVSNATKAVACIAWAGACVTALGACYAFTFPVGIAIDVALSIFNHGKPPFATGMALLAIAPAMLAMPVNKEDLSEKKENSTAQEALKAAIHNIRNAVSENSAEDNIFKNEEKTDESPKFRT